MSEWRNQGEGGGKSLVVRAGFEGGGSREPRKVGSLQKQEKARSGFSVGHGSANTLILAQRDPFPFLSSRTIK